MEETKVSTETKSSNKIYEVGFHIIPSVPQDKLGEEFSTIKGNLEKNGAIVISEEVPKFKNLSYEMRKDFGGKYEKYNQAYFGWIKFEIGEGVLEIDKFFKTSPVILRYLLIKTVRENTMTSPKAPSYRRAETAPSGEVVKEEKKEVSETELDKAIDAVIAE